MYSLELLCRTDQVDQLSADLWEAGTAGIRELDARHGRVLLVAGFTDGLDVSALLARFAAHEPRWYAEPDIDWVAHVENAWPGQLIGRTFFLCPPWCREQTPPTRHRLVHNPGLACGTGEHPCTRLAIEALEKLVQPGIQVADIGTGSGILAVAACQLGASNVIGIDPDEDALRVARENLQLNHVPMLLVAGFADCLASEWANITVANISGTVLMAIADNLLRLTKPGGMLVLTGFTGAELAGIESLFGGGEVLSSGEWSCLIVRTPDAFDETAPTAGASLVTKE